MIVRLLHSLFFLLFLVSSARSQKMPVNDYSLAARNSFIRPVFNQISNIAALDSFYQKLYQLKNTGRGQVSIVHLGDSHLQAGYFPAIVRKGLQAFFGNAGRGLLFPYQLARSNAPPDLSASSDLGWQYNRLAHPEIPVACGLSGYAIVTTAPDASFHFELKPENGEVQRSDKLSFFFGDEETSWRLETGDGNPPFDLEPGANGAAEAQLPVSANEFKLTASGPGEKKFYGLVFGSKEPGIVYHAIGVNGARYDHFNQAELFWEQAANLHAALVIISLGTNEAQAASFDENAFLRQADILVNKVRSTFPGAAILVATAADSYKQRRPNIVLRQLNASLSRYCVLQKIALWDLYSISGGYGSAHGWYRNRLMNPDRIHFTSEGYNIQGSLLLNALARGYNGYTSIY